MQFFLLLDGAVFALWVGFCVTVTYVHRTLLIAAYWVFISPFVPTGLASGHTCINVSLYELATLKKNVQ